MTVNAVKTYVMRRGIEQFLKEYVTRMVDLSIDPEKKTVRFSVELKGEEGPIDVEVQKYELENREGKLFLIIHEISISKEWMNVLAAQVIKGNAFELGEGSKRLVEIMRMMNLV